MPRPERGNRDRAAGRKANLVSAPGRRRGCHLICAALVLCGPLGGYGFERRLLPTDHELLIPRVQIIVSLVFAASVLALLIASAAIKATRTLLAPRQGTRPDGLVGFSR
ncbi:MAG: hypothetical protein K0U78_00240 [Actinomycetia bacterium]|nr:hypothetical protein [Actinomycetes bacterium]